MKIKIFESKREIDLSTFIDSRALICANSGGGKSYAIRKILEESDEKVMSIVLDVEGEFKTLREKFNFLLIGQSGDVPLNINSAHLLPRKLLELNVSTIIDISDLKMHERILYAKKFLEALMEVPRELWKPCIIVLDEAHLLAGQQEKQDSTHAVIDLMTRGRKRGFCGILATQRIAKLHKDAVAEANNILIGRTGLDIDMKRASEILGFTSKQDMLSLRDLDAGEFFVFGTAISKGVEKEFVGEVKTTHPKVGMDIRKSIIPPTEQVKKILTKLSDLPQEAKKELKDREDMQKEIIRLKSEIHLAKQNKPSLDEKTLQQVSLKAYREAESKYLDEMNRLKQSYNKLQVLLEKTGQAISSAMVKYSPEKKITSIKPADSFKMNHIVKPIQKEPISHRSNDTTISKEMSLGKCDKTIYSFLYAYPNRTFTKSQVGAVTGYSSTSGGFNNALSKLNSLGLIKKNGDNLQVNEINSDIATTFDFSINNIINILNKCEKEIYQVLLDNPNNEFSREELASSCPSSYSSTSGGFNNSLSRLKTLGLIEKSGNIIKLNSELLEI